VTPACCAREGEAGAGSRTSPLCQLFCKSAFFGFFLHNYASISFISKNGPYARRHHHWRQACVCAGANNFGVQTSDGGMAWNLRGTYLGAIDLGAEVAASQRRLPQRQDLWRRGICL
jgi:hypothetical protein